ncbi:MAG: hypothetical protein AAB573_00885 [Patescibacteria group bacterium]
MFDRKDGLRKVGIVGIAVASLLGSGCKKPEMVGADCKLVRQEGLELNTNYHTKRTIEKACVNDRILAGTGHNDDLTWKQCGNKRTERIVALKLAEAKICPTNLGTPPSYGR